MRSWPSRCCSHAFELMCCGCTDMPRALSFYLFSYFSHILHHESVRVLQRLTCGMRAIPSTYHARHIHGGPTDHVLEVRDEDELRRHINDSQQPVVVHFTSQSVASCMCDLTHKTHGRWCHPCKKLRPLLHGVVGKHGGDVRVLRHRTLCAN